MTEVKETARPRFYLQPIEDKAATLKEGRPIFTSKRFVELKHPGDKSWSFVEEVDENGLGGTQRHTANGLAGEDYSERFPREWANFKKGEERAAVGTPLDEWTGVSRSRVAELKAMNIFTVEEYADIQDGQLQKLGMGTRAEREKARTYIAQAAGSADMNAMATQMATMQDMIERLQQQLASTGAAPAPEPQEKSLEDCTDDELKAFIKQKTGKGVQGQPNRDTLLARAAELAEAA